MDYVPFIYSAVVEKVHDADSIEIGISLGFDIILKGVKLRLNRINAPELNTVEGKISTEFLKEKLPIGTKIIVQTIKDKQEKYGRYLAEIFLDHENINDLLISTGKAKAWDGKGVRPV